MRVESGLVGDDRDEHGAVAGELTVRLLAERDGGAHLRLLHHHRLQRQERPGAAARLADHAVSEAGLAVQDAGTGLGRKPKPGRRAGAAVPGPRAGRPDRPPERQFAPEGGRQGVDVAGFSGVPSELAPLHRKFPGLLLNFNFEPSSGRCLRLLPVPHFPPPTPGQ